MREMTPASGNLGIEIERTASVLRVCLRGELDMLTAPLLAEVLERDRASGRRRIVVDMTELQFMDRAGLAALLDGAGHGTPPRPALSVTGCSANVRRVLELTGHEELIDDRSLPGPRSETGSGSATWREA